jgi:hypothetical protein
MTLDTLINNHFKGIYQVKGNILSYQKGLIVPNINTMNPDIIQAWMDYVENHFMLSLTEQGSGAMIEIDNGRTGIRVFDEDQFIACIIANQPLTKKININ